MHHDRLKNWAKLSFMVYQKYFICYYVQVYTEFIIKDDLLNLDLV